MENSGSKHRQAGSDARIPAPCRLGAVGPECRRRVQQGIFECQYDDFLSSTVSAAFDAHVSTCSGQHIVIKFGCER